MAQVFDFKDYKRYLFAALESRDRMKRGSRSAMARAIGCQSAFVSQVLNGHHHFSLEQAERINGFFSHDDDEAHFFVLLLQLDRAGTPGLRKYFQKQLDEIRERRQTLKTRLRIESAMSPENQATYYSSWVYAAAHMAMTIKEFRSPEALAERLRTELTTARQIMLFLESAGLIEKEKGGYRVNFQMTHLAPSSPFIRQHHTNWRLKAMESLKPNASQDLHYSGAISLARADIDRIREVLILAMERIKKIVGESGEEELVGLNLDFFEL